MTEPAHLCIARHGETDWNADGILQGWLDVPLNAKGRSQARELAADFRKENFDWIYCSDLSRSLETAQILSARLGLPLPIRLEGLKERNFGIIQGVPKQELSEFNPVLYQQIVTRNPACTFDQGESMDEFADRIMASLMQIGAKRPGKKVLVITHGWVLDVIIRHIKGVSRSTILHVKPKNGHIIRVRATSDSVLPE